MFPDGTIVDNPRFDTPEQRKANREQMAASKGWFFDSKHEARTFWLRAQEFKKGSISKLSRKHKLELVALGGKVVDYLETDMTYVRDGVQVVEDAKGSDFQCTPDWKLKWKWLQALHPDWQFVITYQESYLKSLERKKLLKLHKKQLKLQSRDKLSTSLPS